MTPEHAAIVTLAAVGRQGRAGQADGNGAGQVECV